MIKLFISDISALDMSLTADKVEKFKFLSELVINTKNEKHRRERIGAYITLFECYFKLTGKALPDLFRDEKGKVQFVSDEKKHSTNCLFNISHTDNVVVIAFCTSPPYKSVGVDIEQKRDVTNADRLNERYLKNANNGLQNIKHSDVQIEMIKMSSQGCITFMSSFSGEVVANRDTCSFIDNWTGLEAVLKADGGGFSSLSKISELSSNANILNFSICLQNKEYSLALALI